MPGYRDPMSGRHPSLDEILARISAGRGAAPLAPVTVICPSHIAALQLRRRLAAAGPFAAVRFEILPRLAELIGAGRLAAAGRRPLARPIGDHLAERVAAQARPPLARIADLPGFARTLRRLFARLRRAGLVGGEAPPAEVTSPHLGEVMRLYALWRAEIASFYDDDDLLDAAAQVVEDDAGRAAELGELHLVPPGPRSASGERLLVALSRARGGLVRAAEPEPSGDVRLVLAPDLACEAREAAREVLVALGEGVPLHEVAVLHGADPAYARPLREAMEAAGVPVAAMPGLPLLETPAGRGVLALLETALEDLSRTAVIDTLSVAPMRRELPAGAARAALRLGRWDRLSRTAGVTHGISRWREAIGALCDERRERIAEAARDGLDRDWMRDEIEEAQELLLVVETLWSRVRALQPEQPAVRFLARLRAIVVDYLDPSAAGTAEVLAEVDRLGTVDAVGGAFSLMSFHRALRVNLEAASIREGRFGEGVLVADHRLAGGLRFQRVVVCGTAEGLLPAGPGADALVPDAAWEALRRHGHPLVEDAALRLERSRAAAARAVAAGARTVMTCPLYESAGAHEHYPSPVAVAAARRHDDSIATASALREHGPTAWLARPRSPLAANLRGPAVDAWEIGLRAAVERAHGGMPAPPDDPLARPLRMLRARRSETLSEWDGNLTGLGAPDWMRVPEVVSPTRLEHYGACGFRFLLSSLLGLRVPEEPRDPEAIDPIVRGNLMHATLEDFFREQHAAKRPAVGEAWTNADEARAQELLSGHLDVARRRGLTGLPVFSRHDERTLRSDLSEFLHADTDFRRETGAVPVRFEARMEEVGPGGQRFRGFIDRIDERPVDGRLWIIDYKTGRPAELDPANPLANGTRLQLPVYLLQARGAPATASYWYITARGGFARAVYEPGPVNDALFGRTLSAIADAVAGGSFPAVPGDFNEHWGEFENCGRCDFTRICSRARGDDFARKAEHADVGPWRTVAEAASPSPT